MNPGALPRFHAILGSPNSATAANQVLRLTMGRRYGRFIYVAAGHAVLRLHKFAVALKHEVENSQGGRLGAIVALDGEIPESLLHCVCEEIAGAPPAVVAASRPPCLVDIVAAIMQGASEWAQPRVPPCDAKMANAYFLFLHHPLKKEGEAGFRLLSSLAVRFFFRIGYLTELEASRLRSPMDRVQLSETLDSLYRRLNQEMAS